MEWYWVTWSMDAVSVGRGTIYGQQAIMTSSIGQRVHAVSFAAAAENVYGTLWEFRPSEPDGGNATWKKACPS